MMCSYVNRCVRIQEFNMHESYLLWHLVSILRLSRGWPLLLHLTGFVTSLVPIPIPIPDPSLPSSLKRRPPLHLPHHLLPIESSPLHRVTSTLPWCSWTTPASLLFLPAEPKPSSCVTRAPPCGVTLTLPWGHKLEAMTVPPLIRHLSVTWALPSLGHSLSAGNTEPRPEESVGSGAGTVGASRPGSPGKGLRVKPPGKGSSRWYAYLRTSHTSLSLHH